MNESALEKKFANQVKSRGGYSRKWVSPSHRGVPDRLVIWPGGRVHFIELKTERGSLSRLQELEHRRIKAAGGEVFVLHGWAECEQYLLTAE